MCIYFNIPKVLARIRWHIYQIFVFIYPRSAILSGYIPNLCKHIYIYTYSRSSPGLGDIATQHVNIYIYIFIYFFRSICINPRSSVVLGYIPKMCELYLYIYIYLFVYIYIDTLKVPARIRRYIYQICLCNIDIYPRFSMVLGYISNICVFSIYPHIYIYTCIYFNIPKVLARIRRYILFVYIYIYIP